MTIPLWHKSPEAIEILARIKTKPQFDVFTTWGPGDTKTTEMRYLGEDVAALRGVQNIYMNQRQSAYDADPRNAPHPFDGFETVEAVIDAHIAECVA